ncbi:MAG: autotransporter-associated beta strand repeat-containing protein, partial [Verrucomicrobiota bacterium]
LTVDGAISGTVALTKTGSGTLTLTGSRTFVGAGAPDHTVVNGGSLVITGAGAVHASTVGNVGKVKVDGGSLTVSAGAVMKDEYLTIGSVAGQNGNSVAITGAGSRVEGTDASKLQLYVGNSTSTGNSLTVSDGGYLKSGGSSSHRSIIGCVTTSTDNWIEITGTTAAGVQSKWEAKDNNVYIGNAAGASRNSIRITDGGWMNMMSAQFANIGNNNTAIDNFVTISGVSASGSASTWSNANGQINIGGGGTTTSGNGGVQTSTGNSLTVKLGGVVSDLKWLMVGNSSDAANNNSTLVQSAGLLEINSGGGIVAGTATATGNTVTVDTGGILQFKTATPTLTIGAGAGNAITINGGTLSYKGATGVDMSANKTAGVGVGAFTWSGLNTFRLDSSLTNTTDTGATAYTFANDLGATNYTALELLGTTSKTTTITRAITIDGTHSGTLLVNNVTATVTGGITLTGAVNVTASGTASALTGVVTGGGSLTKLGSATLTLASTPSYSGDTTISAGTLKLNSANASNESSTVTIASTGAALELGFSGTDTVAALVIGISPMPPGVYKSNTNTTDSGTAIDQIIGTGTLTVSSVPAGGYASWALGKGLGGSNNGALQDPNKNGICNLLEYVLNGSPLLAEAPQLILPTLDASGTNFIFTFTRRVDSTADTSQVFNYGTTLAAWTPLTIPAAAGTYTEVVVGSATGTAPNQVQAVTITLPKGANTHLFGSLHVTQP